MDAQECRRRLCAARVAHLATVDAAGTPHLVPITFALVGDVVYSAVDAKPKRAARLRRLDNIRATGRACLLADGYDEDWTRLWWVRGDARAEVVGASDEADLATSHLAAKYPQYAAQPPAGPVVRLRVHRWSGWAATS